MPASQPEQAPGRYAPWMDQPETLARLIETFLA